MAGGKLTALRIPADLLERIESYGKANHPKGSGDWEITATLLDLLGRGLEGTPTPPGEKCYTLTPDDVRAIVREELGRTPPLPIPDPAGGLSNAELSALLGVPKSTIEKWGARLRGGGNLDGVKTPKARGLTLTPGGWILSGESQV